MKSEAVIALANRVFHQRLQHEVRHQQIQRARLNAALHFQTLAESHLFDLQVFVEIFHLPLQRHFLLARAVQRQP